MFGSLVQSWIVRRRILCSVELWIVRQMLSCESECWQWMDPDEPNPVSWVPVCSHCSKGGFILLRTCSKGDEYCCNTPNTKRSTDQWQQQPHLAQTLVQRVNVEIVAWIGGLWKDQVGWLWLWVIFRLSRNIFYTSTAFLVHNYLDWDFAFWNQGLHCHFQSEVVFCFCLLDNKCSLLAGSNLIAFCLLIVQPLLDVYRRLAGHWKEKGRTCRGMPMRQTHKNIGKGVGMVRRYVLDLLLILLIFSSSEYYQELKSRWGNLFSKGGVLLGLVMIHILVCFPPPLQVVELMISWIMTRRKLWRLEERPVEQ